MNVLNCGLRRCSRLATGVRLAQPGAVAISAWVLPSIGTHVQDLTVDVIIRHSVYHIHHSFGCIYEYNSIHIFVLR